MQRITISLDEALAAQLDALFAEEGYQSRSEGVRDLIRKAVALRRVDQGAAAHSVGTLSYIYDRGTRALAQRIADLQHEHHNLIAATTQVRLDHEHSLEAVLLKGLTADVQAFADRLKAERGVRFGELNLIGVEPDDHHSHPEAHHHHHDHAHLSPTKG